MTESDKNSLVILNDVIECMIVDMDRTWAENCNSFSEFDICNCQNELFCGIALCKSKDLLYLQEIKKYKHRKIKELLKKMLTNSEEELVCDHIWYAYNVQIYLDSMKKVLGEFL